MSHVILVGWNAVDCYAELDRAGVLGLRENPPDVFMLDLDRRPAQGRDLAIWLRQQKATRSVPIVFVGGDPEKTQRIRKLLPDAAYTEWSRIRGAIHRAIQHPHKSPTVPGTMDSYTGAPLPKKLGIREGTTVALAGAPAGFERTLSKLPDDVRVVTRLRGRPGVILLFVKSQVDLKRRFPAAARALADGGKLWIVWPKRASGVTTDLTQITVRAFGLAADFVDYKISAIDETWSGLCFARRRK